MGAALGFVCGKPWRASHRARRGRVLARAPSTAATSRANLPDGVSSRHKFKHSGKKEETPLSRRVLAPCRRTARGRDSTWRRELSAAPPAVFERVKPLSLRSGYIVKKTTRLCAREKTVTLRCAIRSRSSRLQRGIEPRPTSVLRKGRSRGCANGCMPTKSQTED